MDDPHTPEPCGRPKRSAVQRISCPGMSDDILLRHDLEARGITAGEIRSRVRSGSLVRVRRGAYAPTADPEPADASNAVRRHRLMLDATVLQLSPEWVVSHMSAALLHGLPTWNDQLARVQLTRGRPGGGKTRPDVLVRGLPLEADQIVHLAGRKVTALPRTVLDLACLLPLTRSVAVGDAALRLGLDRIQLESVVADGARRTGIGRARIASGMLDMRSESPGESASRVIFQLRGLPAPDLQYEVYAADGRLVGRCDAAWPELRTLGEFDGRTKYGRLLRPGQRSEDVVYAEKLREDALRELGWEVVRWTWADLRNSDELVRRIERAFERGRRHLGR